ncbi:molybdenum ABC transporter ATP-binding protein [Marinomonas sp. PE14-40]|uniref:molybdenum ABC transporter ATP-binding protein n=1 Tax=Marinomonas sp. PE14-40 TaxID=3060621 RepID=UPI003F67A10A
MSYLNVKIRKRFGNTSLAFSFELPKTGVTMIYGPSGAGKTSLINMLSGLTNPDMGKIKFGDDVMFDSHSHVNVKANKRQIGYVFQDARLFPHLNVNQNLFYASKSENNDEAKSLIKLLALNSLLKRMPNTLSGGEKQRVAIGRALLSKPKLLLLDEPLASLDQAKKKELLGYFKRLVKQLNIPIIMVSHDEKEAMALADNLILIDKGKVVNYGPLETVWNTQNQLSNSTSKHSMAYSALHKFDHLDYAMSQVEFIHEKSGNLTGSFLWMKAQGMGNGQSHQDTQNLRHKQSVNLDNKFRLLIDAQDVSIALDNRSPSSIRNRIVCRIISCQEVGREQSLLVNLADANGVIFMAKISNWAWREMKLKMGMKVVAQIKSTSLIPIH